MDPLKKSQKEIELEEPCRNPVTTRDVFFFLLNLFEKSAYPPCADRPGQHRDVEELSMVEGSQGSAGSLSWW